MQIFIIPKMKPSVIQKLQTLPEIPSTAGMPIQTITTTKLPSREISSLNTNLKRQGEHFRLRQIGIPSDTNGTNFVESVNQSFDAAFPFIQAVDQKIELDKASQKLSTKLVYTEPLSKKYSLEVGYELTYNFGNNDQVTFAKSVGTDKYDLRVDTLTNEFKSHIFINKPSAKINYSFKKVKFNFGSGIGFTRL